MSEDSNAKNSIDLAAARAKLAGENAPRFWQSLEELSETKKFREFRDYEFPPSAGKGNDGIEPPRRAEADGRFGGNGGPERVHEAPHRKDRSVRASA